MIPDVVAQVQQFGVPALPFRHSWPSALANAPSAWSLPQTLRHGDAEQDGALYGPFESRAASAAVAAAVSPDSPETTRAATAAPRRRSSSRPARHLDRASYASAALACVRDHRWRRRDLTEDMIRAELNRFERRNRRVVPALEEAQRAEIREQTRPARSRWLAAAWTPRRRRGRACDTRPRGWRARAHCREMRRAFSKAAEASAYCEAR